MKLIKLLILLTNLDHTFLPRKFWGQKHFGKKKCWVLKTLHNRLQTTQFLRDVLYCLLGLNDG